MGSSPRIFRAVPQGQVTRARTPIAVVATMRWSTGEVMAIPAEALAWTREAVEVSWTPPGGPTRTDWIPAGDVRRAGGHRCGRRPRDRHRPASYRAAPPGTGHGGKTAAIAVTSGTARCIYRGGRRTPRRVMRRLTPRGPVLCALATVLVVTVVTAGCSDPEPDATSSPSVTAGEPEHIVGRAHPVRRRHDTGHLRLGGLLRRHGGRSARRAEHHRPEPRLASTTAQTLFEAAVACDSQQLIALATRDQTNLSFGLVTPAEAFVLPETAGRALRGAGARARHDVRSRTRPADDRCRSGPRWRPWPARTTTRPGRRSSTPAC